MSLGDLARGVAAVLVRRAGLLLCVAGAYLLSRGMLDGVRLEPHFSVAHLLLAVLVVYYAARILFPSQGINAARPVTRAELFDRFEFGCVLLLTTFIAIQMGGGPESWAHPLAYVTIAYLVGFNQRWVGLGLTVVAIGFEVTIQPLGPGPADFRLAIVHGGYLLLFGLANLIFLQVEVARHRGDHERRLAEDKRAIEQEARDFRLISSSLSGSAGSDRAAEEQKLSWGAVEAIHSGMFFVLDLLKKALDLQSCVLLWLDHRGETLQIKEMVTDSSRVRNTPIPARSGALGGIIKNRLLLNLSKPHSKTGTLPYYESFEHVGAFIGVPVIDEGHLRGVLCADRRQSQPFNERDEALFAEATRQILRAIQTERVFVAVERSKYEHQRFYRASTTLNSALTLRQVYDTAFAAMREITEFEFAALTLYDAERRKHTVCRVVGLPADRFEGQQFGDNAGLVAMVVKNKHFLPAGGHLPKRDATVFTKRLKVENARSLVVLPLVVQDHAIGTIVLGSSAAEQYPKRIREMLGVITNQVAVAIENAKMYKRMEEMATTDGLTRLPNHRTFQARFSEMLDRAERHGKPVSLVLTDVDKFKSVNDTYGHPVGDQVLKRVAAVLAQCVRKVDCAARYGGEEFAIVVEETDSQGARLLCERIREQVAAQVMQSDKGSFRVTLSLGIASYPEDGVQKEQLIERADQALYAAKEGGRNRSVRYADIKRAQRVA